MATWRERIGQSGLRCVAISGSQGTGVEELGFALASTLGWQCISAAELMEEYFPGSVRTPQSDRWSNPLRGYEGLIRSKLKTALHVVLVAEAAGWYAREFSDVISIRIDVPLDARIERWKLDSGTTPVTQELIAQYDRHGRRDTLVRIGFDLDDRSIYDLVIEDPVTDPGAFADRFCLELQEIRQGTPAPASATARPVVGAGLVVAREDGALLLARRLGSPGRGTFGCCGGRVEYGESIETCLRREAWEELGVRIRKPRFLAVTNFLESGSHFVDLTFAALLDPSSRPVVREPQKFDSLGWYSHRNLPGSLFEPVKQALEISTFPRFLDLIGQTEPPSRQLELFVHAEPPAWFESRGGQRPR